MGDRANGPHPPNLKRVSQIGKRDGELSSTRAVCCLMPCRTVVIPVAQKLADLRY